MLSSLYRSQAATDLARLHLPWPGKQWRAGHLIISLGHFILRIA